MLRETSCRESSGGFELPSGFIELGPIEPYGLADLYAWLEAHSGLSHPYIATPTLTIGTNSSSSRSR